MRCTDVGIVGQKEVSLSKARVVGISIMDVLGGIDATESMGHDSRPHDYSLAILVQQGNVAIIG